MIALQDDETKPARPDLARQLILLGSSVAFKNKVYKSLYLCPYVINVVYYIYYRMV